MIAFLVELRNGGTNKTGPPFLTGERNYADGKGQTGSRMGH